jgi:hypothetical protein
MSAIFIDRDITIKILVIENIFITFILEYSSVALGKIWDTICSTDKLFKFILF